MKNSRMYMLAAATAFVGSVIGSAAQAGTVVTTADPGGTTTEIGARIRWGASGFEASLWDANPFAQTPTLNPAGSPLWGVGNAYKFEVTFSSITGTLGLSVDFNRDLSFGAGESITRNAFTAPSLADYTGYGFNYLSITGNEGGSTARSVVNNLVINGASLPGLTPNGLFLEQYYKDSSGQPMTNISITGDLTFTTSGTSQERPSWNFNLKNSAQPSVVPLPAAVWAGMALLGGLAGKKGLRHLRTQEV